MNISLETRSLWMLLGLIVGLSTGCAPAPAAATPTLISLTPTPTIAPSPTPVPTQIPSPMPRGGLGRLLIVVNNQLLTVNADGSGSQTIISKQQFEKEFAPLPAKGQDPYWSPDLSPDGRKLLVITCTCLPGGSCQNYKAYLSNIETGQMHEFLLAERAVAEWSPDSSQILILSPKRIMFTVSADVNYGAVTNFPIASSAYWSGDGKLLYYYEQGWFSAQSNGKGAQPMKCSLCSLLPDPAGFAVEASPNGERIAIGTGGGTVVIANASDLNQLKLASVDGSVSRLHWSPDSQKLAIDVDNSISKTDVVILDAFGTAIEKLPRPEGVNYLLTCGWSPDSSQLDYLAIHSTGYDRSYNLDLHTLGQPTPFGLFSAEGDPQSCTVWPAAK